MCIVALIMAGGKGTRFARDIEKPMAIFNGKPLIRRVIEATQESERIKETYVAITATSPRTAEEAKKESVKVILTAGKGYHEDLQQAIKEGIIDTVYLLVVNDLYELLFYISGDDDL